MKTEPKIAADAFLHEARAGVATMILASRREPSFEDVLARARQIDATTVPASPAPHAATGVLDLDRARRAHDTGETALDALVGDARRAVGRLVQARKAAPVPRLARPSTHSPRRWVLGVVGAAAAAALIAGIGIGIGSGSRAQLGDSRANAAQATRLVNDATAAATQGDAVLVEPAAPPPRARVRAAEPAAEDTEDIVEILDDDPVASEETGAKDPPRASGRAELRRERVARLTDKAHALWRDGDLAGARKAFSTIVAVAGKSRAAELAYADLFTLARQTGDGGGRTKLWHAYIRRFPRGRFADDARAGLCRTASSGLAPTCWRRYLASFPSGSYRTEAEREAGQR